MSKRKLTYKKVSLDEDQLEFIEAIKKSTGASVTSIISAMIRYFMANPSKLYTIEPLIYEEERKRGLYP